MSGARVKQALSDRFVIGLLGIVLLGLVLRIAWVIYAARNPVGPHDPFFYLDYAQRIAEGGGYSYRNGEPTAYYPVGYPAVLGAVAWLVQHTPLSNDVPLWGGVANALFGAATVGVIGVVTARLVGRAAGIAAALLLACFPGQIFYSATLLSEPLFGLVLVLALFALVPPAGVELRTRRVLLAGVLLGAATLTRPLALLIVPLVGIAWWVARWGWARVWRATILMTAGAAFLLVPWTVRNWVRMGEPVPISTNTGDNLCIGHNPDATGAFNLPEFCSSEFTGYGTQAELERNRDLTRRATTYALHHPQREIPLLWWRAYWTYRTDDDGLNAVESYGQDPFIPARGRGVFATTATAYWWGVVALAIVGVGALATRRDWRRLVTLAFLVAMFVSPLAFFADGRFKSPFALLCVIPAGITLAAIPRIRRACLPGPEPEKVAPPA